MSSTTHTVRSFRRRRGGAVLETALVLGILLNLAFGTVEFGYFFFVKNSLQGAAREGGRAAIVASATNTDVTTAITNSLDSAGIPSSKYTVTLSPSNIATAAAGTQVTVTIAASWGTVGVRPLGLIGTTKQVIGTTVMRKE